MLHRQSKNLGEHTDTGEGQRSRYREPKSGGTQSEAEVTGGVVSSTETGRDSHTSSDFGGSVTEKRKRVKGQFSISEDAAQPEAAPADIVSSLPRKAQNYLEQAERQLVSRLGGALSGESLPNGTSCSICC